MRIKDYILETIIVVRLMIVTLLQIIVKPFYIEFYKTQTKVIITASWKERKMSQNPVKLKVKSGKLPEVLKKLQLIKLWFVWNWLVKRLAQVFQTN